MFGIGWSEFILIALVLLIFVGPKQLPPLLRKAGMIVNELKRAGRELQHQVTEEVRDLERTVGPISTPKKMLRDMAEDAVSSVYDPYADISDDVEGVYEEEVDATASTMEVSTKHAPDPPTKSDVPRDPDIETETSETEGKTT